MPQHADSNYSMAPYMNKLVEPTTYTPSGTYEQQMIQDALASANVETADQIRLRTPPLPITAFPPKFGYRNEQIGIADIANLDNLYQRVDFTGKQSGYQGTSTPSLPAY